MSNRQLALAALLFAVSGGASAGPTYDWTGMCEVTYCNMDPAGGALTLADGYVPGSYTVDPEDFVAFSYFYYVPTYEEDPPRLLRSGTVTRESLGKLNFVFDPHWAFAIVECEDCPPGLPTTGSPIAGMSFTSNDWSIGEKYNGTLTTFVLRPQSVPEPGSMVLLAFGLVMLAVVRRRPTRRARA